MALSHRRRVVVLLTALAATASTAAPASAADWSQPQQLGPSGDQVDIAVNSRGDLAALWTSEHLAKARYRPAGADWRKPQKVGGRASTPAIILDDRGAATAVWTEGGAAVKRPGQSWRRDPDNPFTSHDTFVNMPPAMATTPDGLLYLGWTENDNAGASGASWTTGHFRSRKGEWELNPVAGSSLTAVAFTPDRYLNIAQRDVDGGLTVSRARRHDTDPKSEQLLRRGFVQDLELVSNARGDLALVGVQYLGDDWPPDAGRLVAFTKPDGRQWRPMLSDPINQVREPAVALNDRGRVAITYLKGRDTTRVMGRSLPLRGRADGGARRLSARGQAVVSPDVALDEAGRAVFLWVGGREADSFTPQAVRLSPSGHWAQRRRLARPDGTPASQPQVVARGRGKFTAVYVDERPMYVDLGR